ncbi:MAG: PatA/PatG family cyanobactin maturation protease [Pseudolabrys sp.]|nr:PatA/PatG family cyanobactin maturation protease [Pseudolabrys sp.]
MVGLPDQIGMLDPPARPAATNIAAALNLDAVWAETRGDPGIRIAILDGPVDLAQPCFAGARISTLPTLAAATVDDSPACRHGTHVASLIFGQHGGPVIGVAPNCTGLALAVFSSGTDTTPAPCSQLDLARAILQAVESGAHIINISGGQLTRTGESEPMLDHAIGVCAEANVLVACDQNGEPLDASNWGATYRQHGVLAPGVNIPGALPGQRTGLKTGTSFATPLVAGVAALLLSAQLKRGEAPDPRAVRAALLGSAFPCNPQQIRDCRRFLAGRINPAGALDLIGTHIKPSGGVPTMNDTTALMPSLSPENPETIAPGIAHETARTTPPETRVFASETRAPDQRNVAPQETLPGAAILPDGVNLSDCGCGCGGGSSSGKESCSCAGNKTVQLVYALGKLGIDFGTEARRDRFIQYMGDAAAPYDPVRLGAYLNDNPDEAASLIWTLNLDATPIYAIVPSGPFAELGYRRLREVLDGQTKKDGVEMVSVPGYVGGSVTLMSGQKVPLIAPAIRGLHAWSIGALIKSVLGARPRAEAEQSLYDARASGVSNFLSRVYYDLRNLGLTGSERALNYAATNAYQASQVITMAGSEGRELDTIVVRKSPVCRPDSECYDVEVSFFGPDNVLKANRVFRYTVDVSDVIPVTIGDIRTFAKRGSGT